MISMFWVQATGDDSSNLTRKQNFFFRAGIAGMKYHKYRHPSMGEIILNCPHHCSLIS